MLVFALDDSLGWDGIPYLTGVDQTINSLLMRRKVEKKEIPKHPH